MPTQKKIIYFLGSFVIAVIVGVLTFVIVYNLTCVISPPYVINDATGEKHATMPLGQFFIGIVIGMITGIIAWIMGYKRFVKIKH